jgi:hypothetical protein
VPYRKSLDDLLTNTALLFGRTLTEEEGEIWKNVMKEIPATVLVPAFENWQRNGRFFPKPKDILELVEAYKVATAGRFIACGFDGCVDGWKTVTPGGVDRKVVRCECWATFKINGQCAKMPHFGQGYGSQDISFLWKLYKNKADGLHRPLSDAEISGLLDELDKKRKRSPMWRKTA